MKNKGFTLVEVLAVLIIISIIGLVAIPIVSDIITKSERETAELLLQNVSTAASSHYRSEQITGNKLTKIDLTTKELEYDGGRPEKGFVYYNDIGDSYIIMYYNGYCLSKNFDGNYSTKKMKVSQCDVNLDLSEPNIAIRKDGLVTSNVSLNILSTFFDYSSTGTQEITESVCIDRTNGNQEITNTNQLSVGKHTIECTITQFNGISKSQTINIEITNCFSANYDGSITGYDASCGTSVIIPDEINGNKVATISSSAFYQKGLISVDFNSTTSLRTISSSAFYNNQIKTLAIPDTVTNIGSSAFAYNQISELTIPNSVTSIGSYAFQSNRITSLTLSNKLTNIGYAAFISNQIKTLTIPNSVTNIESSAFQSNQIRELTISTNVRSIGSSAFSYNQISELTIPNNVTSIGSYAFQSNRITSLTLSNKLTNIGYETFSYNQISELTIPNSVTSIGSYAFQYNQISELTIPNTVTSIGEMAFFSNNLKNIEIPTKVTYLGYAAFSSNLVEGDSAYIYNRTTSGAIDTTVLNSYAGIETTINIPSTVSSVMSYSFYKRYRSCSSATSCVYTYRNGITSLTIPNSVTSIGSYAFQYNQISELTIPNSVTSIGSSAFDYNNLNTVTLGTGVTSIGSSAFYKSTTTSRNYTLTKIINPTGRVFNWYNITGASYSQSFTTGTIVHSAGNIIVSTS